MPVDRVKLLRTLRRVVFVHKSIPIEAAWKYLDYHGIPREELDKEPPPDQDFENRR